jgi:alpha-glucosidase
MGQDWWRSAVIYQIYPRSFQDSNGDGIGDLRGITQRLDHVADLGADAIWLSPFFTSPDRDMGYDVSDYTGINPIFGTMQDFDDLLARAHDLGLKVIIDQVISHTSDQHPWFIQSRQNRTNPKADWYVWADPKPDGTPPNNWLSVFGGSAWMFDPRRRQYYLHNFLTSQPDINFHCAGAVDALMDAMRFWLDRGVDGFRLDTVNFYTHDAKLRDNPPALLGPKGFPANPYEAQDHDYSKSQPENLAVIERLRALTDSYEGRVMVGEVGDSDARQIALMGQYTAGNQRLHMAYSFAMLGPDYTPAHIRACITDFETGAPDGWPCWSFSNHDVARHTSRWAPSADHTAALARQAIALLIALPGTIGIYQGEELGQTQTDIEFHELRDLGYIDFWPEIRGRDGCRTPMVWSHNAPNGGFSSVQPWLPVKPAQLSAALDRQGEGSVLAAYRAALAFRRASLPLRAGGAQFYDLPHPILALRRSINGAHVTAIYNMSPNPQTLRARGDCTEIGPSCGQLLAGGNISLPAYGYVFLTENGTLELTA